MSALRVIRVPAPLHQPKRSSLLTSSVLLPPPPHRAGHRAAEIIYVCVRPAHHIDPFLFTSSMLSPPPPHRAAHEQTTRANGSALPAARCLCVYATLPPYLPLPFHLVPCFFHFPPIEQGSFNLLPPEQTGKSFQQLDFPSEQTGSRFPQPECGKDSGTSVQPGMRLPPLLEVLLFTLFLLCVCVLRWKKCGLAPTHLTIHFYRLKNGLEAETTLRLNPEECCHSTLLKSLRKVMR